MLNITKKGVAGLLISCTLSSSLFASSEKTYAIVNGEAITSTDIAVALRNPNIQFGSLPKDTQKKVLDSIIEEKLLAQEAMKSNIPNTKEYKEQLKRVKENLAFQIWMRDYGKNIKVSTNDVKKYYEQNKTKYKMPMQLKASHILVKTKSEAQNIINELSKAKDIKATFTKLAKEKSTGPSGANGGELGWFPPSRMVPEFSKAAMKLSVGTFTKQPVKTQFGYHIIYLDGKKPAKEITFDSIKQKLAQELMQKQFLNSIKKKALELKSKAKIIYK